MRRTAAAWLIVAAVAAGCGSDSSISLTFPGSPTPDPAATRTSAVGTPTAVETATRRPTSTPQPTATTQPTSTTRPTATAPAATRTVTRTSAATATATARPTSPAPTATAVPATRTATVTATATAVAPTATRTAAATATASSTIAATATVPPSPTASATSPPTATTTATGVPTATVTATGVPTGTSAATATSTQTPPATPTFTFTPTALPSATPTGGSGAVCGNRVLEAGETCTTCPADCVVGPCASPGMPTQAFVVDLVPPLGFQPTTATVLLGYNSTRLSLPGMGTATTVRQRVVAPPPVPQAFTPNDLDYAVRVLVSRNTPLGTLFTATFDRCAGGAAPTLADVACSVESCAAGGSGVPGCTCTVRLP